MNRIVAFLALSALASIGTPAQSQQHTVSLAWTASTDAAANPSLTYNVYRSSACSGMFVQLNASPVAATTFLDAAVFPGTYCYQVTSVLNGAESTPSNQATAVIPAAEVSAPSAHPTCVHRGAIIGWLRCIAALPRVSSKDEKP